jgi:hypothetical protein
MYAMLDGALLALSSTPDTTHDPCIVYDIVAVPPLYACCRRGHQAVAAAADEAVQHIANSRAAAEELRAQQAHREAELSQHCSQLQQQADQMQDALQQQLDEAQQTAAARQQQLMVRGSEVWIHVYVVDTVQLLLLSAPTVHAKHWNTSHQANRAALQVSCANSDSTLRPRSPHVSYLLLLKVQVPVHHLQQPAG